MSSVKDWLDPETVAEWLDLPLSVVKSAVAEGEIPALKVAGHIRISRDAILNMAAFRQVPGERLRVGGNGDFQREQSKDADQERSTVPGDGSVPVPVGLAWITELTCAPDFSWRWPTVEVAYVHAWEGEISLNGETVAVKIGESTEAGRRRLAVFGGSGVMCEFTETSDGLAWASLIKPDGRKSLKVGDTPPSLYRTALVRPYREVTGATGSGVPKALAVVVEKSDRRSLVHHGAARWLGKARYPVEPAIDSR